MTDQLLQESRVSLTLLAQEQCVSVPTVWRWTQRGNRGHVLETFSIGGRKYTTREAFRRWVSLINGECCIVSETPSQRARAARRAEQRAAEMGV